MAVASSTQPQPAFGSWVTAGAGLAAPSDVPITLTLGTACASGNDAAQLFVAGEPAWIVKPDNSVAETVFIKSVSNNTLVLGNQTLSTPTRNNYVTLNSYPVGAIGTGAFLIPKPNFNNIIVVYEDNGAGPWLYIGKSPTFTTSVNRIFKLPNVASGTFPTFWNAGMFSPGNPYDLSELYIRGTLGDQFTTVLNID